MSRNLIDAIDNFSESLKGQNVDSMNLIQAIDNLSDIIDGNSSQIIPGGNDSGESSSNDWPLADRMAKGSAGSSIIEGSIEGNEANIASGWYSHAEGYDTTASGYISHAEGSSTTASGNYSHSEGGNSIASGQYSHAEGSSTQAIGDYSHAEGISTVANNYCQHVFGEWNEIEPVTAGHGTFVEIVGNGNRLARSNARTLDWQGNETLAGSLTLGNTTLTEANLQALLALLNNN